MAPKLFVTLPYVIPKIFGRNTVIAQHYEPLSSLDFSTIHSQTKDFASFIETHFERIADVLLSYESFEVVKDETMRSLDLLKNIHENKAFFTLRIGEVTSFLPRNQPLYALTCFVIIPSLMASIVNFRIPHSMRHFFPELLIVLKLDEFFPNIRVSRKERIRFLKERSAIRVDPRSEESAPVTDVVIFTGTPHHAEQLRRIFDPRTLFIANGSGHNPIIVTEHANLQMAAEGALALQLYNQGQDCAAPNSILIHNSVFTDFMNIFRDSLKKTAIGLYRDRSCRIGPISEPADLERIQRLLVENRKWLDPTISSTIHTRDAIVEPTIICKPLSEGGNFTEVFAPIIFAQRYSHDSELSHYFEHPRYARNAMYISLYGESQYVDSIIGKPIAGKILHDKKSILRNTHLHAPGIERGTKPYGGYGYGASSLSINGEIICKPTLPQRDIYEYVAKSFLVPSEKKKRLNAMRRMQKIQTKDIRKLLGLKNSDVEFSQDFKTGKKYIDTIGFREKGKRFVELAPNQMMILLDHPNVQHIATMEPKQVHRIRELRKFILRHRKYKLEQLHTLLYSISKKMEPAKRDSRSEQKKFFRDIYQLLLGADFGPRLAAFLRDADRKKILELLNV